MKEIIKENIFVSSQDHLELAITFMNLHKVTGLAVVDNGKLVGVLSAKDFLKTLVSSKYLNGHLGKVEDYMIKDPKTIPEGAATHSIVDQFVSDRFHYYPVVDSNNNYRGTIYRPELLKLLSETPQTTW